MKVVVERSGLFAKLGPDRLFTSLDVAVGKYATLAAPPAVAPAG
jgi:hypothetical protein